MPKIAAPVFHCRATNQADFLPGVKYTGASSGVICPGSLAQGVFGDELDFGRLFAYCFRRFGLPNIGSDDYKDIANYLVTTPLEGLFLRIEIKAHCDPFLLFGYVVTQAIQHKLLQESAAAASAWRAKFKAWRDANGIALPSDTNSAVSWVDERDQFKAARARFALETGEETIDAAVPGSVTREVEEAIKTALEDLKSPVAVRDSLFSAVDAAVELPADDENEDVDEDDDPDAEDPRIAPRHASAGYFVPSAYMSQPKRFAEMNAKLLALGEGSLDRGIDRFVAGEKSGAAPLVVENGILREALQFYADGSHFVRHDAGLWDTVSGEPGNFFEDEANSATVEDGSVAKLALDRAQRQGARPAGGGADDERPAAGAASQG